MSSSRASIPVGSISFRSGSNSQEFPTEENGVNGNDRLHELEGGIDQFVQISRWGILQQAMESLGAPPPEFTVVDIDDCCVKVSIKLSLSNLTSINGERINYSVIEGETSYSYNNAQDSAILKAITLLEKNYMIKILDFSSRVISVLEGSHTKDLLVEGIGCIQNLFVQWDLIFGKYKHLSEGMHSKKLCDYFGGLLTANGNVYRVASDYMDYMQSDLHLKAEELRLDFDELKSDWLKCQEKMQKNAQMYPQLASSCDVILPSKLLLDLVLSFFGTHNAEYISRPDHLGMVKSEAQFEFPYMDNFKYGGKLAIQGTDYSSAEADEEAAYHSLLFIEKNFSTHVLDYNYTKCKKTRKAVHNILLMVQRAIEIGSSVRMLFGELINSIKVLLQQFSFDTSLLFSGPMCAGQIEAYQLCANGIKDLDQESSHCSAACEPNFVLLQKLAWKQIAAKTNLPI